MIARQLNLFVRAYRAALLGDAHGARERLASQLEPPPILPEKRQAVLCDRRRP